MQLRGLHKINGMLTSLIFSSGTSFLTVLIVKSTMVRGNDEKETLASILETRFLREATHLPRLHHQNVVKFVIPFGLDIARGMEYVVHAQGIIHRDLKPENVLVDEASLTSKLPILAFLVSGTLQFENWPNPIGPIQVAVDVADANLRPIIPSQCPRVLRDLIQQCWALKP
ncbi:hypothetical protein CR513_60320, partial [Mucuna pruriens]